MQTRWRSASVTVSRLQVIGGRRDCATHSSPNGDAVFFDIAKIIGFKRVPIGKDDRRVIGPLEVHLHVVVMKSDPQLLNVWKDRDSQVKGTIKEEAVFYVNL